MRSTKTHARRSFERFKSIKRGYYSLWALGALLCLSLSAELWVSHRALIVSYQGQWYFPTYANQIAGTQFGFDYDYETNYRDLKKRLSEEASKDWVLLPLVPWSPLEMDSRLDGTYPPFPPSTLEGHYLGTDKIGRDVLARLLYGFRIAISFSLLLTLFEYLIGIVVGSTMAFFGGTYDLFWQRIVEIWSNIPFLYVVIIVSSIMTPQFLSLVFILSLFGWVSLSSFIRSAVYKEKARDYVRAARALGASRSRIMFIHILPNTLAIITTFVPFSIAAGISALTSLDFLGFGLAPPTPSWGELLNQGLERLDAPWILGSVVSATIVVLLLVTFVGEATREALDPKSNNVLAT